MFSFQDMDEAVAEGAVGADAADRLRAHLEAKRATPTVDEEQFRLLTGFNDIFVSIAAVIMLFSVGFIGLLIGRNFDTFEITNTPIMISAALVAATAWGLALFFTARRRMALPSILLLLAFVGGVFIATSTLAGLVTSTATDLDADPAAGAIIAFGAAVAAWLHWRRFHVPITVAAGAAALAGMVLSVVAAAVDRSVLPNSVILGTILLLGLATFLLAMRWDSSDPERVTRRSDVAFWLHLLAAPMIVHPIFALLGLTQGTATVEEGVLVVLLYIGLGLAAMAIDRRALLVSALAYVLYALSNLFSQFGAVDLNVALTALVIGSALLLLSAFWHQARRAVVGALPMSIRQHLPTVDRVISPQPAV